MRRDFSWFQTGPLGDGGALAIRPAPVATAQGNTSRRAMVFDRRCRQLASVRDVA